LFVLCTTKSDAQNISELDTLKYIVENSNDDTLIIGAYYYWGDHYWKTHPDSAIKYYLLCKEKAKTFLENKPDSISRDFAKETLTIVLNDLGFVYSRKGYISEALKNYHESLKNTNDQYRIAQTMNNLGFVYSEQDNIEKALDYYNKSIDIKKEVNNQKGIATSYNNIGGLYEKLGDLNKTEIYYRKALEIREALNDSLGMSISLNNLGSVYLDKGLKAEAEPYFNQAYAIQKRLKDKRGMCFSLMNLCEVYFELNQSEKLKKAANTAYTYAKNLGYNELLKKAYEIKKKIAVQEKDFKSAYQFLNEEITLKDTIANELNKKEVYKQQAEFEYQKKAAVDSIAHAKELQIKESEKKQQIFQRNTSIVGLLIALIFIILIFRSNLQKKKTNLLLSEKNEEITSQNKAIEDKNHELNQLVEEVSTQRDKIENQRNIVVKQKEEIEEIHNEISESINYATRLQSAILPDEQLLNKYLSDYFVFFRPKDKVSGDFYWWSHVEKHTIITAADCTGHGVPGAFMSMLGSSLLREIVQKEYITHTGVILRKLRKEVVKSLKQKGEAGEQKDGMDMAIISINNETQLLQYSGANNPLYIITNNSRELNGYTSIEDLSGFYEIKADKMPISIYDKMDSFTSHEIQLEKGDRLFMFSDGYADQFGGPRGKKYKYKPFKRLLSENRDLSMHELNNLLNQTFNDWKGELDQIDDVLIIGLQI
jgi:serine phosphatase RsbU (regulator of sigma subunit)